MEEERGRTDHKQAQTSKGPTQTNTICCSGSFTIVYHRFFSFLLFLRCVVGMGREKGTHDHKQAHTSKGTKTNKHHFLARYASFIIVFLVLALLAFCCWNGKGKGIKRSQSSTNEQGNKHNLTRFFHFWLLSSRLSLFFSRSCSFCVGLRERREKRAQPITNKHDRASEQKQTNTISPFGLVPNYHCFFLVLALCAFCCRIGQRTITDKHKRAREKAQTNTMCSVWFANHRLLLFLFVLALSAFCCGNEKRGPHDHKHARTSK